jgi:MinD-like ATPase involved in chromosome partitioning or flagellar assembly
LKLNSLLASVTLGTRVEPATEPKVIAITSPYGSTGKTTVAINLAAELAASKYRVLIIDADLYGLSVANYLCLAELPAGFAGALRIASQNRFDKSQLERLSVELSKPKLTLLAGSVSSQSVEITSEAIDQIIETAKANFDFTVIDLASWPQEKTTSSSGENPNTLFASVLAHAGELVVVALADPVGIFRFLNVEQSILSSVSEPKLVINRLRNSVIPNARHEILQTLQRLSAMEVSGFLPDDPAHIDQATKDGTAASLLPRPGSFRQAMQAFSNTVILRRLGQLDGRIAKLG